MHISEGVLSTPVLCTGAVVAVAATAAGLRRMRVEQTPQTAMLAAVFFVASLIHIPFGPVSVHMLLNGLAGIVLGWSVFPAFLVALLLQAVMFQFGGLTTLGVNILVMGVPALVVHYLFRMLVRQRQRSKGHWVFLAGAILGALAVALSGAVLTVALAMGGRAFLPVALSVIVVHIPVMLADGLATGAALAFVVKVRPDIVFPRVPERDS